MMSDESDVDFFKELDEDLPSEEEEIEKKAISTINHIDTISKNEVIDNELKDIQWLTKIVNNYNKDTTSDAFNVKVENSSPIVLYSNEIRSLLQNADISDPSLLNVLNSLSLHIKKDLAILYNTLVQLYRNRFLELESLLSNHLHFVKVVNLIEKQNGNFPDGQLNSILEQYSFLPKEQILVVTMSFKSSFNHSFEMNNSMKDNIFKCCNAFEELTNLLVITRSYIAQRINKVAPNICALLGPEITTLLIAQTGGLKELCMIPSCNLASIGKNKHLSHELHTTLGNVSGKGYIYNCDLIQEQPFTLHKQLLRALCARVTLASRVDMGQLNTSNKSNQLGLKWKEEIVEKIRKLNVAPDITKVKPLPIPEDKPKKRRGGRKVRKYRQQFQLSNFRKLQNRMEFGKKEEVIMSEFGEEIELGMTNSAMRFATGDSKGPSTTVNNNAKMTKDMKKRLKAADTQAKEFLESLENDMQKPDILKAVRENK